MGKEERERKGRGSVKILFAEVYRVTSTIENKRNMKLIHEGYITYIRKQRFFFS